MYFIKSVLRISCEGDKAVEAGQKALERIQNLVVQTMTKYEGVPHALTLDEMAPLQAICGQLVPANFRLKVPDSRLERPKRVHYKHIYEDKTFSMGIFILPPGVSIPLHDHPGMSVISRLLYGTVHVKAFELVKDQKPLERMQYMARLCKDTVVTAPHTMELLPDCGNLHELIGGDDIGCAFLDIITPPYCHLDGRDCTYFRVVETVRNAKDTKEKLFILEAFEPIDFDVIPEDYDGPQLPRS